MRPVVTAVVTISARALFHQFHAVVDKFDSVLFQRGDDHFERAPLSARGFVPARFDPVHRGLIDGRIASLGRVLINRQPNSDLDELLNVWGGKADMALCTAYVCF
jgi:hypothetical protein